MKIEKLPFGKFKIKDALPMIGSKINELIIEHNKEEEPKECDCDWELKAINFLEENMKGGICICNYKENKCGYKEAIRDLKRKRGTTYTQPKKCDHDIDNPNDWVAFNDKDGSINFMCKKCAILKSEVECDHFWQPYAPDRDYCKKCGSYKEYKPQPKKWKPVKDTTKLLLDQLYRFEGVLGFYNCQHGGTKCNFQVNCHRLIREEIKTLLTN